MDKETIKQQNNMRDVLARYGMIPNRAGFISCPFHSGDCTASMKIYKDSYYCFGCGASGDIFTFVQNMDNCDFKTAFQILGGTYHKPDFSSRMAIISRSEAKRNERESRAEEKKKNCRNVCPILNFYRSILGRVRPLSDGWCEAWNKLQLALYKHGFLTGLEEGD